MDNDDQLENFASDEINQLGLDIAGNVYNNFKELIKEKATNSIMGLILGQNGEQLNSGPIAPGQAQQGAVPGTYMESQFQGVFEKRPNANRDNNGFNENLNWSYGGNNGRATPFSLNPSTDCYQDSQIITTLFPREFYTFYFRVLKVESGGKYEHSIALLINCDQQSDSGWFLNFHNGNDEIKNSTGMLNGNFMDGHFEVSSYLRDEINNLLVIYDGKYIKTFINSEPLDPVLIFNGGVAPIYIRCIGMTASFFG